MITEDYVSFETAKLLKGKGFGVPSFKYQDWVFCMYDENGEIYYGCYNKDWYPRITLQMAMKMLREKCLIICVIPLTFYCGEKVNSWGYNIWTDDNLEVNEANKPEFNTYEEACEAAIKYCLDNLI